MGNRIWPIVAKINKRIERENITLAQALALLPKATDGWDRNVLNEAASVLDRRVQRRDNPETAMRAPYPVLRKFKLVGAATWDFWLHPTKGWRYERTSKPVM